MSNPTIPTENPILAAWQQQMLAACKNPFLLHLLLKQWQRILKRLAYFYAQLAALPRRNRRALQRALATSLVGAALLLALSSAPVALANSITVSGACTLDEAITNANEDVATFPDCAAGSGADTIYLTGNVTLAAALPNITSEITLEGANFYVSGADTFRVFYVESTGDFSINETTVQDGDTAGFGGGIYSQGALTITNSTISGNDAGVRGGGIFNQGSTVTLTNSTISGNSASNQGGGIYSYSGTVELNSSTVSGNSGARGAGINIYGGTVTLNDSTVTANIGASNSYGGGLYNYGNTVTLNNSTVSGNTATEKGGGIYNVASGSLTMNNSTVSGNDADRGGGIFNIGTLELNNSTVSGNDADRGGGIFNLFGTLNLNNSTVSGNTASDDGGGIYNNNYATLNNSTVSDNTATTRGGGIFNNATLHLHRSLISGNAAVHRGNEIYNAGVAGADDYNLFGHSGETNAQALEYFTPGVSDFNATSDGDGTSTHVPTVLASILDTTLALNGGTTENHALVSGSPALDKAPNAACLLPPISGVDQRGFPRNVDIVPPPTANDCDIGSFELQATTAVHVAGLKARVGKGGNVALTWHSTTESQIAGFNVWRKVAPRDGAGKGEWKQINAQFLQAKHAGDVSGDSYRFKDKAVKNGKSYRYKLQVLYLDNHSEWTEVVKAAP